MARNGRPAATPLATRLSGGSMAIDLYLDELGRYPLLDSGQEDEVARRARAGDRSAFETLIRSNLRFVVSVAKRYQNRGLSFSDLVQEGNVGLVTAAEKFDPDQGVKFISYAVWWIRQAILAALARHSRSVRLPLNRATELGRVLRTREDLRQSLRREPTSREIGEAAELDPATVEMLQALNMGEVRLDAPVGESDDNQLQDRILLDETDVEREIEDALLVEHVDRALRLLRPRDARVVRLYYGLQGESEHTLEEIGKVLGITRERVRQLRDRALRELRQGELGKVLETYAA
ncbi:MAG: sigma-70 family RNA polymerase sigma factor [Candidatus Palauibacterales bacterium]|nr:sigma-70 family RNA polymerase sigma factor [Candidatus Palauibacterales bacterium]MDP2530951.1 sigma-70 family RNA polymerase sigma factor [Candidatus Palauibacterales bacterium]MDP2583394.1 sigma-70 family RNA polymerase sigma factor [Candidatus Palauibacterales bacterium]